MYDCVVECVYVCMYFLINQNINMLTLINNSDGKIMTAFNFIFHISLQFLTVTVFFLDWYLKMSLSCLKVERMGELPEK